MPGNNPGAYWHGGGSGRAHLAYTVLSQRTTAEKNEGPHPPGVALGSFLNQKVSIMVGV